MEMAKGTGAGEIGDLHKARSVDTKIANCCHKFDTRHAQNRDAEAYKPCAFLFQ
jgi:hypothetical protein